MCANDKAQKRRFEEAFGMGAEEIREQDQYSGKKGDEIWEKGRQTKRKEQIKRATQVKRTKLLRKRALANQEGKQ